MSQATQEPSESSPETTASQVAEELGVFFFELPGSVATSFAGPAVSAAGAITGGVIPKKKNLVILQEHRDLIVKLEYPQNSSFRLYSPEKRFYDPLRKEQTDERLFASGEDVHLWLSKFHQPKIQLQRKGEDGQWEDYSFLDPAAWDTEDYSALIARPAPIILKVGPPDSPIGTSMKPPAPRGTIPAYYQDKLMRIHESLLDPTATKADFLRQWHTNKFPELELPSNSDPDTQQETDVSFVFEVTPDLALFRYASETEEEKTIPVDDGLTARDLADAMTAALKKLGDEVDKNADVGLAAAGQFADKAQLVNDLQTRGTKVKITSISKNGSVKKFVVLSGNPKLRTILTGTRYGIGNPKVITIAANQLNMGELASAAGKNVRDLAKPGTLGGKFLIIGLAVNTWQWMYEGGKETARLFAKWIITIVSSVILAAIEEFITAAIGAFLIAVVGAAAATPVVIAIAAGLALFGIGVGISYLMGWTEAENRLTQCLKDLDNFVRSNLLEKYNDDLDATPFPGGMPQGVFGNL